MKFCPECELDFSDDYEVCPKDGAQLVFLSREEDLLIGKKIDDRYTLEDRIGEGGMGAVYVATQTALGRKVAVKVLRRDLADDPSAVKRFFHEAKVVSRLRHPNTITLYDFGQSEEGLLYIAMEFMTGRRLDNLIEAGKLTLPEILEIAEQICQSLEEAHDSGIVHRDLKPENVFIDAVGNRNIVKVLDFGIAKVQGVKSNLTLTGMVFGTPAYMSPEQAQGFELDKRTDIYSLGVVLFELICGRLPYEDTSAMRLAMKHILNPIPSLTANARFSTLPQRLDELVTRMMAKEQDERPSSVESVRATLSEIMRELETYPVSTLLPRADIEGFDEPTDILVKPEGGLAVALRERKAVAAKEESPPLEQTGPNRRSEVYTTAQYRERKKAALDDLPRRRSPLLVRLAVIAALALIAAVIVVALDRGESDDAGTTTPARVAEVGEVEEHAVPASETEEPEGESDELELALATASSGTHEELVQDDVAVELPRLELPDGHDILSRFLSYAVTDEDQGSEDLAPEDLAPDEGEMSEQVTIGLELRPRDARVRLVGSEELLCEGDDCAELVFPWGIEPIEVEIQRRRYEGRIISFVPDHEQSIPVHLTRTRERDRTRARDSAEIAEERPESTDSETADESPSPLMTPVTIP